VGEETVHALDLFLANKRRKVAINACVAVEKGTKAVNFREFERLRRTNIQ
jgi:hypothetical protein